MRIMIIYLQVYPLIAILTGACGLATFFGARAALKYPDVA